MIHCCEHQFLSAFNCGHDGCNHNYMSAFFVQLRSTIIFHFSHFLKIASKNLSEIDVLLLQKGRSAEMDHLVRSAVKFWIERTIMIIFLTHGLTKVEHSSNSKSCWRNHSFVEIPPYFEISGTTTTMIHCCHHQFFSEFNGGHDGGNQIHL